MTDYVLTKNYIGRPFSLLEDAYLPFTTYLLTIMRPSLRHSPWHCTLRSTKTKLRHSPQGWRYPTENDALAGRSKNFFFRFSKIYATTLEKAALDEAIFPKWKGVFTSWPGVKEEEVQTFPNFQCENVTHYCVVMYAFNGNAIITEVTYDLTNNEMLI